MFFTTTSVPFESMSDVVQAYPNWRLLLQDGYQGWILEMATSGDPDFTSLWQQYQKHPSETLYDSIEDGLELIETGHNVILMEQNRLLGHLKSHPTKQNIFMSSLKIVEFRCLLFQKNSPLLPMFNQGVSYLWESGLKRKLFHKWFGDLDNPNGSTPSEGHILTLGQMVTALVMMLVVFVVVLFVLCGELTFKRLRNRLTRHDQTRKKK